MLKIKYLLLVFAAIMCFVPMSVRAEGSNQSAAVPLPPSVDGAPDLQLLVISGADGKDMLNITYGTSVSQQDVQQDLLSISSYLSVDTGSAKISNSALPISGMTTPVMTSATVTGKSLAPVDGTPLPLAQLIVGLRRYHRLQVTFLMPSDYVYGGVKQFQNKDVQLSSVQNGSTSIFNITILNNALTSLTLPNPSGGAGSSVVQPHDDRAEMNRQKQRRLFGILIVVGLAFLTAVIVYFGMSRIQVRAKA